MTELRSLLPRSENGESEIRSGGPKILFETDWCADGYPSITRVDRSGLVETSTRGIGEIPKFMTIYSLYRSRAERMADRPLYTYRSKDNPNKWLTKTAAQTLEDIRKLCKGFIGMGLKHGEGVALMCSTCYEWNIIDAGVMSIGGVLSTIYDTDSPKQMKAIIENSGAKMLIVETKEMKAKAELAEIGKICQVFCMEDEALEAIKAYGQSVSDEDLNRRIDAVQKTDLCSIVYTSGSTSAPKGVEITHENFCAAASNLAAYLPSVLADPKGSALLFLPMAHVFARTINYMCVFSRVRAYISNNFKNLVSDLQYSKPTAMIGVPRVYEKLYNAVS
ncbi:MAG: AMP-binding protein, partial [Aeriscardovia sp.]|nr:AMP-binding protein [Aeriscardovia sp.]